MNASANPPCTPPTAAAQPGPAAKPTSPPCSTSRHRAPGTAAPRCGSAPLLLVAGRRRGCGSGRRGRARTRRRATRRDRGARQPELDRHRQRHAAADALDQHRQRALGHGAEGQRRRQRPRQEGPGAGRARHRQAARPDPALARRAGRRRGEGRADRGDDEGGAGPTWRGFEEVARLSGGKVPSKTELDSGAPTLERAHGRRGQRPRQRRRRAGGAVHRRDQPVQGVDPSHRPTAWC